MINLLLDGNSKDKKEIIEIACVITNNGVLISKEEFHLFGIEVIYTDKKTHFEGE